MLIEEFFSSVNNKETLIKERNESIPINYSPNEKEVFQLQDLSSETYLKNGNHEEINMKNGLLKQRVIFYSENLDNYSVQEKKYFNSLKESVKSDYDLSQLLEKDQLVLYDMFRFHYKTGFDFKETKTSILEYLSLFEKGFPSNKTYLKLIKLGFIYIKGRDKQYRPNIIFDVNRFLDFVDKLEYSELLRSVVFVLEYIIKFILVRGKVENWNFVINLDIKKSYQKESFKLKYFYSQLIPLIKNNYPYRTNNIFVFLRTEDFFLRDHGENQHKYDSFLFEFFKDFLNSDLIRNITIINHELSANLKLNIQKYSIKSINLVEFYNEYISKDQVEEKYFGNEKNLKMFFENVNSPGIIDRVLTKQNSLRTFSEISDYASARSIKEQDKSIYEEAVLLPNNIQNFDFLQNKNNEDNKSVYDTLNTIEDNDKLYIDDKRKKLDNNKQSSNNKTPHINSNDINQAKKVDIEDFKNHNSYGDHDVIAKARGGINHINVNTCNQSQGSFYPLNNNDNKNKGKPQSPKEFVNMEKNEKITTGGCCTGKCTIF